MNMCAGFFFARGELILILHKITNSCLLMSDKESLWRISVIAVGEFYMVELNYAFYLYD